MRTETEIVDNILDVAGKDDCIKAVIRTDLLPVRAYLYNYEFYFIVDDTEKYEDDRVFETCLGDRILLYRGDKNYPEMFHDTKAHLMVFRDGVTIVINAMSRDAFMRRYNGEDVQENVWIGDTYQKILDKDGLLPEIERLEEKQTLFESVPTQEEFLGTCSEFRWVLKTFAEYTLREELPPAMFYLNTAVRDLLNRLLRWYIYTRDGVPADLGILDSKLEALLEDDLFRLYKKTYPDADFMHIWEAYEAVITLWNTVGNKVAVQCGFPYPNREEEDMLEFIRVLRHDRTGGERTA